MMAFMQYAMQIIMSFLFISMIFVLLPRAAVSAERVDEILTLPIEVIEPEDPQNFVDDEKGSVEFQNVSFAYPASDTPAISNITFKAKRGETTAIIGATGSGKSTILNLIMRAYDSTEGVVKVSGVDVKDISQDDLMHEIGYVPQKSNLLTGTIESNIKIGKPNATGEELAKAIETAQAVDFVSKLKDGVKTEISQGGNNVSGGQRQRLAIARALIKDTPIYVFDDSFSALDFKTDRALRKALNKNVADACKIIVAQRVSTIMHANQIIVLDEGKIVGMGSHEDLLKTCPAYKEIVDSQMKGGR
ncbi:ABC transporter ATP-binding protein, partial [Treponema sp. R6D11]